MTGIKTHKYIKKSTQGKNFYTSKRASTRTGICTDNGTSTCTRDRGATLRLGRGGAPLVKRYWGGGGHKTPFGLLTLYNSKNVGGGETCPPCSTVPVYEHKPDMNKHEDKHTFTRT